MQNCFVSFYSLFSNISCKLTTKIKYYNKKKKYFVYCSQNRNNCPVCRHFYISFKYRM